MDLSIVLLKTGQTLVSQIEELDYEPKVHLYQPYLVSGKTKLTLTTWPEYVTDEHILLHSDSLLTVGTPVLKVKEAYLDKIGKSEEDLTPKPKPVILNEEDDLSPPDDDEYEPEYIEE